MKFMGTVIFLFTLGLYFSLFIIALKDISRTIKGITKTQPLPYRVGQWLGVYFVAILIIVMGAFVVLFGRAIYLLWA